MLVAALIVHGLVWGLIMGWTYDRVKDNYGPITLLPLLQFMVFSALSFWIAANLTILTSM